MNRAFAQLFATFEELGVFQYVLPFLVIFALVYGILTRTKIFQENPVVNGIIAISVSLLSLQFESVPLFFSKVFPRLGIGLAVILVLLIILGMFMPQEKWIVYVLFGVAAITLIAVLAGSFETDYSFGAEIAPLVISGLILIIIVSVIVGGLSKKPRTKFREMASPILRDLFEIRPVKSG